MSRKAVKLETMDVYKAVIIQWAISEDIGMQKRGLYLELTCILSQ